MTTTETELETEATRVYKWRLYQLVTAGYPEPYAETIASDTSIDLHEALRLVTTRGCDPETAFMILA